MLMQRMEQSYCSAVLQFVLRTCNTTRIVCQQMKIFTPLILYENGWWSTHADGPELAVADLLEPRAPLIDALLKCDALFRHRPLRGQTTLSFLPTRAHACGTRMSQTISHGLRPMQTRIIFCLKKND